MVNLFNQLAPGGTLLISFSPNPEFLTNNPQLDAFFRQLKRQGVTVLQSPGWSAERRKVIMLRRVGDERLELMARLTSSSLDADGTASTVYVSETGEFPLVRVER